MKKTAFLTIIFIIVITVIFGATGKTAKAQAFTAQKAYSDYQYRLSIYQQDLSDFQDAKTFYQKNPTLQLQEAARQKTLKLFRDRDQLVITYLTAIRMQIVETTGFDDTQKGAIFGKIDPEVAWYQTHMANYLDSDAPSDLFNKSAESKSRYATNTTPIIDEDLFDIGLSQEIGLRHDHEKVYADLKDYINAQVAAGTMRMDPFNRWLNVTDAVLVILSSNEVKAAAKIQTIYAQNYGISSAYNAANQILTSSISPLNQLNSYLTEMLVTIQNQN